MDVSVVVVSHNSRMHLIPCITSVQQAMEGLRGEIWLVDNASSDGGPEEIMQRFPWVNILRNDQNLGFARANNQAIGKAGGRYVLVANPDARLHPDCLKILMDFLGSNRQVGIVGPAVYDDEAYSCVQMSARRFPSFSTIFFHRYAPLTRIWRKNPWSRCYLGEDLDRENPSRVDWVSACCLMVRKELLDRIGLFDEQFWMFAEDVDLCRRAWQAGWEVAYEPRASAVHAIGASKGKVSPRVIVERHRSMWIYYRKHLLKHFFFSGLVLAGIALRCTAHLALNALRKTS